MKPIISITVLLFCAGFLCAQTTQPDQSVLKPAGDGWIALIGKSLDGWKAEPEYWKVEEPGVLHGRTPGTAEHHYGYTEQSFSDFELHADWKMIGNNSGICIRIAPTSFDNVPGYQVDMGDGYWGCLWDERGRGKVVDYPKAEADKIVHKDDWNHYYIRAQGHHIQAWLNGVKTIDVVDEKGLLSGPIGFQLTHGAGRMTDVTFKNVVYRLLK
jgi:hypothetical protein